METTNRAGQASTGAVLITGATGGLGRQTARALAARGRALILGGRRAGAVDALVDELQAEFGGPRARAFIADLADLAALRGAVDALEASLGPAGLHGLVTNAGITTVKDLRSAEGYELTFAVNVLAHQLILSRLAPRLRPGGRVVVVASGVHEPDNKLARRSGIPVPRWVGTRELAQIDAAEADARLPPGPLRYSTSKLGNVIQARALQRSLRARGAGVDVFAIDPGLMVDTDLARELPRPLMWVFRGVGRLLTPLVDNMRLSPVSAGHIAALIEDPEWSGRGFAYLDGDRVKAPSEDALREDLLEELWRDGHALIGLEPAPLSAGE